MRILIFTRSEWDDKRAFGNTLSNWFGGDEWCEDSFSNIYMRMAPPSNSVCFDYYRFTVIELIKKIWKKETIGEHIILGKTETDRNINTNDKSINNERRIIEYIHKFSSECVYAISEEITRKKAWNNQQFRRYLKEFNPDIFFTYLGDDGIIEQMIDVVKDNTQAKIVLYAADDLYGKYQRYHGIRKQRALDGFIGAIKKADLVLGASEALSYEYGREFCTEIRPVYKGCSFEYSKLDRINKPIRFVYAGNLYYGRDKVLGKIAAVLKDINRDEIKVTLEIYTSTPVSNDVKKELDIENTSKICGVKPYNEIKQIMNESDIVLHVESFEQEQIDYVRYSFSTKIIDCLQSGSVPFAIGPAGIASIEYLRNTPGALVVDDLTNIRNTILDVLATPEELLIRAQKVREFAMERHDIHRVRKKMKDDFERIIGNNENRSD